MELAKKVNTFIKSHKYYAIVLITSLFLIGFLYYTKIYQYRKEYVVEYSPDGFKPNTLTVAKGDTVSFKNLSDEDFWPASDPHPLHSLYSKFDPKKPIPPGGVWSFKADKIGAWNFHDHLFPAFRGKLSVLSKKDFEIKNRNLKRDEIIAMIKGDPLKTYNTLKNIYDPSTSFAHSVFHLYGEVLYDKFGLSAIEYCDSFAGFGCYHGFFIRAVSEKGVEVAIELDRKCLEKYGPTGLGCPHGIGHGLVEYFGLGKIAEPLEVCQKLNWKGPLFGCASGVFMENNFPTVFDKNGVGKVTTREAHGNLFEPCLTKAGAFKTTCYFEQASWWNEILRGNFTQIGKYCNSLKAINEKESCLLGAGNTAAETSSYSADKVTEACSVMGSEFSTAVCRTGGAWAFFANPDKRVEAENICSGLGKYETYCLNKYILVKENE